jgi:hypothetical protein
MHISAGVLFSSQLKTVTNKNIGQDQTGPRQQDTRNHSNPFIHTHNEQRARVPVGGAQTLAHGQLRGTKRPPVAKTGTKCQSHTATAINPTTEQRPPPLVLMCAKYCGSQWPASKTHKGGQWGFTGSQTMGVHAGTKKQPTNGTRCTRCKERACAALKRLESSDHTYLGIASLACREGSSACTSSRALGVGSKDDNDAITERAQMPQQVGYQG